MIMCICALEHFLFCICRMCAVAGITCAIFLGCHESLASPKLERTWRRGVVDSVVGQASSAHEGIPVRK